MTTIGDNSGVKYLREAGRLIKGDLADVNHELKTGRERKNGILWQVLVNLVSYAQNVVFDGGYSKKLAKQFRADVMAETSLSEKQASKYTENIASALGVRGLRKGLKAIDGLPAAAKDGPATVAEFLKAAEIMTFGQFLRAIRKEKTQVELAAERLAKLTDEQRKKAMELAKDLSKGDDEE